MDENNYVQFKPYQVWDLQAWRLSFTLKEQQNKHEQKIMPLRETRYPSIWLHSCQNRYVIQSHFCEKSNFYNKVFHIYKKKAYRIH